MNTINNIVKTIAINIELKNKNKINTKGKNNANNTL